MMWLLELRCNFTFNSDGKVEEGDVVGESGMMTSEPEESLLFFVRL